MVLIPPAHHRLSAGPNHFITRAVQSPPGVRCFRRSAGLRTRIPAESDRVATLRRSAVTDPTEGVPVCKAELAAFVTVNGLARINCLAVDDDRMPVSDMPAIQEQLETVGIDARTLGRGTAPAMT